MAPKNNERFANVVRETMSVLGLTQANVAERGGPSDTTLRKILDNEPVGISAATLRKLDTAFRWKEGSAAAALAGGGTPYIQAEREFPDPTPQFAPLMAAIAVDADDLLSAAHNLPLGVDTNIDKSDVDEVEALISDVESLVWDVESLVVDIDQFVESIDEYAKKMMDPSLLQRLKRDTQRFRRRQYLEQHGVGIPGLPLPPEADDPMVAYRASPTASPNQLSDQSLSAVEAIVSQSLAEHHAEMRRRAREQARHQDLVHQAWSSLGDDHNQQQSYAPEIGDGQYARYLAARLSTPHQGGDPDLHAQLPLTDAEYDAAQARYRREFAEMVVFDGSIRTVMRTPARNTPSRDATSSPDDTKPALPEVESRLRGSTSGRDTSKRSS